MKTSMSNLKLAYLVVVFALLQLVDSKCITYDGCYNKVSKRNMKIGAIFKDGCNTCTCEKSKNKIMTCYLPGYSVFSKLTAIRNWDHYYVEVKPKDVSTVKCPYGLQNVTGMATTYARFYLTYVAVGKFTRCCDKFPEVDGFCKVVAVPGSCNYRLVLRSNPKIECPYKTMKTTPIQTSSILKFRN